MRTSAYKFREVRKTVLGSSACVSPPYRLLDVAGEDVNLEVFRAPITLSEAKAVTFHRSVPSTSTKQDLVYGEGTNLCTRSLVHNPAESYEEAHFQRRLTDVK